MSTGGKVTTSIGTENRYGLPGDYVAVPVAPLGEDQKEVQRLVHQHRIRVEALEHLWAAVKDRKSWRVGYNPAFMKACESMYMIDDEEFKQKLETI